MSLRPAPDAHDRALLIGASAGGAMRLLQVALSVLLVLVLTRSLPLSVYGVWAALGIVGSLVMFTSGIGSRLCNEMANGRGNGEEERQRVFFAAFSVCARFCWIAGAVFLAAAPLIPWRSVLGQADPGLFLLARRGFIAAVLLQAAGMPFVLGAYALRAFRRNVAAAAVSPLATATSLCLAVAFLRAGWRLPLLLAPFAAWNLVFLASFFMFIRSRGWRWRFVPLGEAWPLFRPLLADSLSFSLLGLCFGFLLSSVTFLTSRRLGYVSAGGLDVYVKIYLTALTGLNELVQPLWPEYLRCLAADDRACLRRRLRSSLAVTAGLAALAAGAGALASPLLVRAISGRAIALPPGALALLGGWLLLAALVQALQMFLNACNSTRVQLAVAALLLLALPPASARLMAAWGRNGMLGAMVLSLGLLLGVMAWRTRVELGRLAARTGPARVGALS